MKVGIVFASLVMLAVPAARAGAQVDCSTARCIFDQAVNDNCSCTGASNHGRYVSCVAHLTKNLADCGLIPTNCKGKVTRCAARSTCGKKGFVTCTVPTSTCDTATGTCTDDSTVVCTTDIQCGSRCSTKHDAQLCPSDGVTSTGSCCPTCPALQCSPSPAGQPGCPCTSNSDCASGNCCVAVGVCG